ncbi:nucleotide exchange factor GrpE [Patescibacteria group bacterium]|nr:nucleotide exchange factor GrpE [Patescibacteria group bacterium]
MKKKNEGKESKKYLEKTEELENQLKRTLADYQNLEKRIAEDKAEWIKMSNRQLLLRLLPSLDALTLAEKHTKDEGVSLSIKTMMNALKAEGVEKIEAVGKDFDPNSMECVQAVEGEEGKVIDELKPGYTLHGKVLRPALVTVGKLN